MSALADGETRELPFLTSVEDASVAVERNGAQYLVVVETESGPGGSVCATVGQVHDVSTEELARFAEGVATAFETAFVESMSE